MGWGWVDREKDGSVKSRLVLKIFYHDRGQNTIWDVFTDAFDSYTEIEVIVIMTATTSQLPLVCALHSCAELLGEAELANYEIWKLENALSRYREKPRKCGINILFSLGRHGLYSARSRS